MWSAQLKQSANLLNTMAKEMGIRIEGGDHRRRLSIKDTFLLINS